MHRERFYEAYAGVYLREVENFAIFWGQRMYISPFLWYTSAQKGFEA